MTFELDYRARAYARFLAIPVGADFGWYEPGHVGKGFPYKKTSATDFSYFEGEEEIQRDDFWKYYERNGWGDGPELPYARPEATQQEPEKASFWEEWSKNFPLSYRVEPATESKQFGYDPERIIFERAGYRIDMTREELWAILMDLQDKE